MSELAFVATCDLVAMVRGRALPRSALLSSGTGVGWVPADLALTAFGAIAEPNPFGASGDLRLVPDVSTEVLLPPAATGGDPLHLFLANQTNLDGTPWECDPRATLQAAIAKLESTSGLSVMASFEHEFTLCGIDGLALAGSPFGLGALRAAEPFGTQLLAALAVAGYEIENWLPEYGAGQFEITLKPVGALMAADRAIILREIVRDIARANSLRASFAPLPSTSSVSNGVHVHLSLWRDGLPVTYQPGADGDISPIAANAFAGILEHAEALLVWTAPSQTSFFRLKPHRWSSGSICIARQNREALLRICPVVEFGRGNPAHSFNVEYRAADATANPWLVLAGIIQAMADGLERKCVLPKVLHGEVEGFGRQLPHSLDEAIATFNLDSAAANWFAPNLVATHLGIRSAEAEAMVGLNDDERCARYSSVY
jgi:glutamine synthetase